MGDVKLPEDYAIDGLSLEAERRAKALGRPYSYGQLIADTTPAQREVIVEDYREAMTKTGKRGGYRVNSKAKMKTALPAKKAEKEICEKLAERVKEDEAGES